MAALVLPDLDAAFPLWISLIVSHTIWMIGKQNAPGLEQG